MTLGPLPSDPSIMHEEAAGVHLLCTHKCIHSLFAKADSSISKFSRIKDKKAKTDGAITLAQ
jgi:hypothetical protein